VEYVVETLWNEGVSIFTLIPLTIWMLSIVWIEQHDKTAAVSGISKEVKLPEELQTEEAQLLWGRLREGGFIVADGYVLAQGVSNNQAAYIADCLAEKLGINNKWKMFGQLWGIKNMAQLAGTWKETGKTPARADEIRALLN
jgi:hypothetical protein